MKSKKIVFASLLATALSAMTIVIAKTVKAPALLDKALATEKSFTFDESVAKAYWNEDIYAAKTIPATAERDAISARADEVHFDSNYGFGKEKSFFWNPHAVNDGPYDTKIVLAVGVNNLQSFSYLFHVDITDSHGAGTRYELKLKFFGENYDVNKCISAPEDEDILYQETYAESSVIRDKPYSATWTKPDQNKVIRYALFELKFYSSAITTGGYCSLFLENIGVTWNC